MDPASRPPSPGAPGLGGRVVDQLIRDGVMAPGHRVLVALSGGLDSTVLLHLLRFQPGMPPFQVQAAHFDHRMRPGSAGASAWVVGLCRAWAVPLHTGRAPQPLRSEDEGREARYRFLLGVKEREGADWVLTGHHGDDQVETVLFRIFRGTGLRGLAGIPSARAPGLYRPLLPFSRADLLDYASRKGVRFLEDPTNADPSFPRNFLRHRILPQLREGPAPGVRESILRLARLARENEEGWESLMGALLEGVLEKEDGEIRIVRQAFLAYHPAVRARLLRHVFRGAGIQLDEAGTRTLMEFTSSGASGGSVSLPGGGRLVREFDRFKVRTATGMGDGGQEGVLVLETPEAGAAELKVGGLRFEVVWGPEDSAGFEFQVAIPLGQVTFPIEVRGWEPGDRISLPYGTKKLKKLFGEAKIPLGQRSRTPVVLDAGGRVLWVPGLASSTLIETANESETFFIGIRNAD